MKSAFILLGSILLAVSAVGCVSPYERKQELEHQRRMDEYRQEQADKEAKEAKKMEAWLAEERRLEAEGQARRAARAADLKDGRVQPESITDLEALYEDAMDGWDIAKRPLLVPDDELYIVSGVIDRPGTGMLTCSTVPGPKEYLGAYFSVTFKKATKGAREALPVMRVNGRIFVVGKYTKNIEYQTVAAGTKIMPVFEAVHVVVPDHGN